MKKNTQAIVSVCYLGPLSWFANFLKYNTIIIEQYENYSKQSYRNRCLIYGANGVLPLCIPVKKTSGTKTLIRDILIDDSVPWNKNHLRTIESAYKNAPFYEQYISFLLPFYTLPNKYLIDFNLELTDTLLDQIGIPKKYSLSASFVHLPENQDDLRYSIHPKKKHTLISPVKYQQVFENKFGFQPGLSIIDLLFNEGPYTLSILQSEAAYT